MAENRLKEVLAFVNHKGGVGKTTSVQNLAAGLRRYGKGYFGQNVAGKERKPRILLIDWTLRVRFPSSSDGAKRQTEDCLPYTMHWWSRSRFLSIR